MVTTPFSSFTTAAPEPGELTGASTHALCKKNQQLIRKVWGRGRGGSWEKGGRSEVGKTGFQTMEEGTTARPVRELGSLGSSRGPQWSPERDGAEG